MIRNPKDLESYVQYVYSTLLNLKDEGVVVSANATFIGKSGARHEIDVFYQFERSRITHKVAFECKYLKRKVEKSDVIDFHGKIKDIGNIQGIFVSKNGYQKGAKEYASHYDIRLLTIGDLPTLNILLANRIESVALPDESFIGEPFWTLMEVRNNELTGNYWSRVTKKFRSKQYVPLFISKRDAEEFLSKIIDKDTYVVRGIPQHSLNFLLGAAKLSRGRLKFSLMLDGADENNMWPGFTYDPEAVEARFLIQRNQEQQS